MSDLVYLAPNTEEPFTTSEVKTAYKDWFPRMCEYGFTEGEDFCSFLSESTGGRPAQDAVLTIDMAKEICMIQRNEKDLREFGKVGFEIRPSAGTLLKIADALGVGVEEIFSQSVQHGK